MKVIDFDVVGRLLLDANPRPRFNIHESYSDPLQRMLVVMRPGEEKPPHANRRELTQIILSGDADMLIYDDPGKYVVNRFRISPLHNFCYVLPPGMMHTKVVRETLLFFEVMQGPYLADDLKVAA